MFVRFEKFPSWKILKKSSAWIVLYARRLQENVQSKTKNDEATSAIKQKRENPLPLSYEEMENAEKVVICFVQKTACRNEIAAPIQPTKMNVRQKIKCDLQVKSANHYWSRLRSGKIATFTGCRHG